MTAEPANILIIDDEAAICDGCILVLSDRGHAADAVQDGRSGLELLERKPYDLVLLDMKLPDIDGMQLLEIIRRDTPRIGVVVMTGYSSVSDAVQAMKLGAFDYLSKPFSDDELVLTVEKAVQTKRLAEENLALRRRLFAKFDFSNIVGEDPKMLRIFDEIRKAAPTDTIILLEGESGTGKELFAKAIHAHSQRAGRQFVVVDCSTFSPSLLESELFGHVKGSFTGATHDKAGIFEAANGGTLFLDEVANLTQEVQAKLLRVMETHEYRPVGSNVLLKTDVRFIAATNRDLKSLVEQEKFRNDLFYRLSVLPIRIPPLRERRQDIPKLAYHFLRIFCREMGRRIQGFSDEALEVLINHEWPGNIRQLKNVVERLVIMADETVLNFHHLADNLRGNEGLAPIPVPGTVKELQALKKRILEEQYGRIEKAFLQKALSAAGGNITAAAKAVGMQRSNFSTLLKRHSISFRRSESAGNVDES
jgi:two-component system NtrC family response regulator